MSANGQTRVSPDKNSGTRRHFVCKCILIFSLCVLPSQCYAESESAFVHASWAGRNGAPQDIHALAQTPDGLLWIASTAGLFTFDGSVFRQFQSRQGDAALPTSAIRNLFVARNGDLWIEGSFSGLACFSRGHLSIYGDPAVRLLGVQQDKSGTLWAIRNYTDLVWLDANHRWQPATNVPGPSGYLSSLFIDVSGMQWIVKENRVLRRGPEDRYFKPTDVFVDGEARFRPGDRGEIWVIATWLRDERGSLIGNVARLSADGQVVQKMASPQQVRDVMSTPEGALWVATIRPGLSLMDAPQTARRNDPRVKPTSLRTIVTVASGSSGSPALLMRDKDDGLWVGGSGGLDRYTQATIHNETAGTVSGDWSVCASTDGKVWVGSSDVPVSLIQADRRVAFASTGGYSKLYCDRHSDVFFLSRHGIGRIHHGRVNFLPLLPNHAGYGSLYNFISFAEIEDDSLIASIGSAQDRGLWRYARGEWEPFAAADYNGFAHAIFEDHSMVYVGRTDGTIFRFAENGKLLSRQASGLGVISAFSETSHGLFVFGANGLAVERNGSFQNVVTAQPSLFQTVTGLAEDDGGNIWLNGARGIVHVSAEELKRARSDPSHPIEAMEWHEGDFVGPASFNNPSASVARGTKGKMWFATLNGVAFIQTDAWRPRTQPPLLSIRAIRADGQDVQSNCPPGTGTVEISYAGVNFSHPENIRYRYELDGVDSVDQEVGTRTEAVYTRLKPGTYTFHVAAANGDGPWSEWHTVFFTVRPFFYQTPIFSISAATLFGFLLLSLVTTRLRSQASAARAIAEERAKERIRVARDLHDTLLQSMQGLLLSFHVAAEQLPPDQSARRMLETALIKADSLVVEGRQKVWELRSNDISDAGLTEALETTLADACAHTKIQWHLVREGIGKGLCPEEAQEIYLIAREAIQNAVRHGRPSTIRLEMRDSKEEFCLKCIDDGRGMLYVSDLQSKKKHWGIPGMTERAKLINARIEWKAPEGGGTEVILRLPACPIRKSLARLGL